MIQNLTVIVISALMGYQQLRYFVKKELTRLKLKRRGSFAGSTVMSLIIRPILEKDRVKAYLSAPLFAAALTVGVTQLPNTDTTLDTWSTEQPVQAVLGYEVKMPQAGDTITYLVPVTQLNGVSQSFHAGHPGIDLMSPRGSQVVAMERGTVIDVQKDTFGYGRHLLVKHMYEVVSLYAHLDQINVRLGQEVTPGQVVGTIGTTGWSTGPHLHFEVYEGGDQVNPMKYIGPTLEMARKEAKK
jgi:murein DD-endopeptidase MepM/ murein hydrolase activator NlpD